MRRSRGFTLTEALISILILSVVMIVALTLLVSMRSFAARQQTFTAPRQAARSAVDYLSYFLAGAADLNVEQGNPNALVMWTTYGKSKSVVTRQASFNNLTAAQAAAGFGDEGTDIITLSVPTNPIRIPIMRWTGNDVAGKNLEINYSAGCPSDEANLAMFKAATGAMTVGAQELSGIITVQDAMGRWRYMQITNYNWSHCVEALPGGTSEVIHVEITPGNSDQLNPPGGWRDDLVEPFTINAGVDFTSFRVRNGNLEQKSSGIDAAGIYTPGIFDATCDVGPPVPVGCSTIGFTPVVENVEDLQIAYVFRDGSAWNTALAELATKSPDGVDSNIPEQNPTVSGVLGQFDVTNVRALRVSVIARSNQLDIGQRNVSVGVSSGSFRRRALEDHADGVPDTVAGGVFDRYRLTTTLVLRNRMLGF